MKLKLYYAIISVGNGVHKFPALAFGKKKSEACQALEELSSDVHPIKSLKRVRISPGAVKLLGNAALYEKQFKYEKSKEPYKIKHKIPKKSKNRKVSSK